MKNLKNKPYIITEIGANHNGNIKLAKDIITEAKKCGADCIKFQIKLDPFEIATKDHSIALDNGKVVLENISSWKDRSNGLKNIFDQVKKYHFNKKEYKFLIHFAKNLGLDVGASVFTKKGVEFAKDMNLSFIKIASMDIINFHLIDSILATKLPLIASSGMATEKEIEIFVSHIKKKKYLAKTALLHCVSIYPPKNEALQLKFIERLKKKYKLTIGYSDHTLGTTFSLIAIALGAEIIEKHFTLNKNLPGWDHKISVNPKQMKELCAMAKEVKKSLGTFQKIVNKDETEKKDKFRRSLTTTRKIKKGHKLTAEDITYKRPGTGIPASQFYKVIGCKLNKNIDKDKTLYKEDINKK